jgi:phosphoribosylformylglycinamidine synthase
MDEELMLQKVVKKLVHCHAIHSAHDCSDGGLFVTLLESAMNGNKGFDINTDETFRKDAFLFGEAQSRVVVTVSPANQDTFINLMTEHEIDFSMLGEVTDSKLLIDGENFDSISFWKDLYDNAIGKEMSKGV